MEIYVYVSLTDGYYAETESYYRIIHGTVSVYKQFSNVFPLHYLPRKSQ